MTDESADSKPRLSDVAYNAVREAISLGQIHPGDWIRQEWLATRLEMSQVTIREALNRLVMEGLAERVPRKGVRLPRVTIEDVRDIYELRIVAEGLAWAEAAQKITQDELKAMHELLPFTGTNADLQSVEVTRRSNLKFHLIAIRASGRWTLVHMLTQLLNLNNLSALLSVDSEEVRVKDGQINIQTHTRLLEALEQRNSALTQKLIVDHIRKAMDDRVALFNKSTVR